MFIGYKLTDTVKTLGNSRSLCTNQRESLKINQHKHALALNAMQNKKEE